MSMQFFKATLCGLIFCSLFINTNNLHSQTRSRQDLIDEVREAHNETPTDGDSRC